MHALRMIPCSFPWESIDGIENSSLDPRGGASKWRCTSYDLRGGGSRQVQRLMIQALSSLFPMTWVHE